jgi:protein SCO1
MGIIAKGLASLLFAAGQLALAHGTTAPGMAMTAGHTPYTRSVETYRIPDVVLTNQDGTKVRLPELFQSDKPVLVQFVFANCTTICPVLSTTFVDLQQRLGDSPQKARLVSISIDPEHDTPKVMKAYLTQYQAKPGWDFLTGPKSEIEKVTRAFGAYAKNKMDHSALTFIRMPQDGTWVRLFGLMSGSELWAECEKVGLTQ